MPAKIFIKMAKILKRISRRYRVLLLRLQGVKVGKGVKLGEGVKVESGYNIVIEKHVRIERGVFIGCSKTGKIVIGEGSFIGSYTIILGHQDVVIGRNCLIAPFCHITDTNHGVRRDQLINKQPIHTDAVEIQDDVWIGAGCSVLPGVVIEKGAVIGARAVVTGNIEQYSVAVGMPARKIKSRE